MSDKPRFDTIDPVDVDLTRPDARPAASPVASRSRRKLAAVGIGLVLLVLVVGVIFFLPQWVAQREAPVIQIAMPPPAVTEESPYREAQLREARRDAQEILARLLEVRETLESRKIALWAPEGFAEVDALAAKGDDSYRQGRYDISLEQYREALTRAEGLVRRSETLVADKLEEGGHAIAEGRRSKAIAAFELALAVESGNDAAQQGLARAKLLETTWPLLERAREQMAAGRWAAAEATLKELLALDGGLEEARERLSRTRKSLEEERFATAMNRGFAAMEAGDYGEAVNRFQVATSLDPDSVDARSSLAQARNRLQAGEIARTLARARTLESEERWADAADAYGEIVARDDSVVAARVGQLRARARADLDSAIGRILDDPLRLASGPVFVQAQQLLRDARRIDAPGPALQRQVAELDAALERARQPVTVTLASDSETRVTLLRVGDLGTFERHNLELRPGRYVALGSRPGYRDVRVPFEVAAGESATVTVICTEPV